MIKFYKYIPAQLIRKIVVSLLIIAGFTSCEVPITRFTPVELSTPGSLEPTQTPVLATPRPVIPEPVIIEVKSRGYLTTPEELIAIADKAEQGLEPYRSAVDDVLQQASEEWNYELNADEACESANEPVWIDNRGGTPRLYAKALAYYLTGDASYAEEVKNILERIMTEVKSISMQSQQCLLNFAWGTPELVISADLIEEYWINQTCTGPISTSYYERKIDLGNCKELFQNWLVKNPYYVISFSAATSKSNAGAAATNTTAYIADYLWDRPDMVLLHRNPPQVNNGRDRKLTPSEAFAYANKLALDRMNGYGVEYGSSFSCDFLDGEQQNSQWLPVKSQISETGIIPEEARRQEHCNVPNYNGAYQNYPQLHLGNNIQQCELMLRRGDASCYDNVDNIDIPDYIFTGPDGELKTTHLLPGRGSIERAIKAIIVDTGTEWRHDSALVVAYRYYYTHHTLPGFELWPTQLSEQPHNCGQDICFGTLTHGFALQEESPGPPPTVPPP